MKMKGRVKWRLSRRGVQETLERGEKTERDGKGRPINRNKKKRLLTNRL